MCKRKHHMKIHVQEEAPDEDDPHDIQIEEVEGERDVEGPPIET